MQTFKKQTRFIPKQGHRAKTEEQEPRTRLSRLSKYLTVEQNTTMIKRGYETNKNMRTKIMEAKS